MEAANAVINPNEWVSLYADDLYYFAFGRTSSAEVSEDLVQETFLAGLKSQENFKGNSSEKTWLFSILKNKIADYYKKSSTQNELNSLKLGIKNSAFFTEEGVWQNETQPKDWSINSDAILENKELASVIADCLKKLKGLQLQVITLKLIEDDSSEIICKDLNISSTNYWVLFHRAKLQLRACLENNWINL